VPQRHFVHHKIHMTRPGIEPGPPLWEASDKRLVMEALEKPILTLAKQPVVYRAIEAPLLTVTKQII
jgi:hypothetical protein